MATDAVGMGLNLNIKRIIFSSIYKSDSTQKQTMLCDSDLKQIAGRAGRLEKEGGYVLGMSNGAIKKIKEVLGAINSQYQEQEKHSNLSLQLEKDIKEYGQEVSKEKQDEEDVTELLTKSQDQASANPNSPQFTETQKQIKKAILMPSFQHIEEFSNNVKVLIGKEIKFSEIIRKLDSIAKVGGMYTLQNYELICIVDGN